MGVCDGEMVKTFGGGVIRIGGLWLEYGGRWRKEMGGGQEGYGKGSKLFPSLVHHPTAHILTRTVIRTFLMEKTRACRTFPRIPTTLYPSTYR